MMAFAVGQISAAHSLGQVSDEAMLSSTFKVAALSRKALPWLPGKFA